nr:element excision factor XisI family protein [Chamaesiphon sp. OTE_20_metabat_361]
MNLTLKPELTKFIQQEILTGKYANPEEAIEVALNLLKSKSATDRLATELREKIDSAAAQLDSGEGLNPEDVLAGLRAKLRTENPWLAVAGNLVDDPFFDDYVAEIDRYRTESARARGNNSMDNSLIYADIIENTLKEATRHQPRIQSIRLYPVCDRDSGNFLILATGWDKKAWINTILFHARLVDEKIAIEEDNFEEGLTSMLIEAGIDAKNIHTSMPQLSIV